MVSGNWMVIGCHCAYLLAYPRLGWSLRRLKGRAELIWLVCSGVWLGLNGSCRIIRWRLRPRRPLMWSRIFWIMSGSVTSAITRMVPLHNGRRLISRLKTRLSRRAQVRGGDQFIFRLGFWGRVAFVLIGFCLLCVHLRINESWANFDGPGV